mmetsp:Transcript_101598/g.287641  ORF Transcript_101598/g.287641 Transcript_101598/m.287641 type:complete len:317 (-) Transcript_101598:1374-2324(-)
MREKERERERERESHGHERLAHERAPVLADAAAGRAPGEPEHEESEQRQTPANPRGWPHDVVGRGQVPLGGRQAAEGVPRPQRAGEGVAVAGGRPGREEAGLGDGGAGVHALADQQCGPCGPEPDGKEAASGAAAPPSGELRQHLPRDRGEGHAEVQEHPRGLPLHRRGPRRDDLEDGDAVLLPRLRLRPRDRRLLLRVPGPVRPGRDPVQRLRRVHEPPLQRRPSRVPHAERGGGAEPGHLHDAVPAARRERGEGAQGVRGSAQGHRPEGALEVPLPAPRVEVRRQRSRRKGVQERDAGILPSVQFVAGGVGQAL